MVVGFDCPEAFIVHSSQLDWPVVDAVYKMSGQEFVMAERAKSSASNSCLPYTLDLKNDIILLTSRNLRKLQDILLGAYIIGIDSETRPSFYDRNNKYARNPTSLIQVAVRNKKGIEFVAIVDLLQMSTDDQAMDELNNILHESMSSADVVKVGQGLENDFREICASYPCLTSLLDVPSILDTNVLYRQIFPEIRQDISLKSLVLNFLHLDLIKTQQCSDWARRPLSSSQIDYAAGDALILLRLFDAMTYEAADRGDFDLPVLLRRFQYGVKVKKSIKPLIIPATNPLEDQQISTSAILPLSAEAVHTRFDQPASGLPSFGNSTISSINPVASLNLSMSLDTAEVLIETLSESSSCTSLSTEMSESSEEEEKDLRSTLVNRRIWRTKEKLHKTKRNDLWRPIHIEFSRKRNSAPFFTIL